MRLCKDCNHARIGFPASKVCTAHPELCYNDLVNGGKLYPSCEYAREWGQCGEEGELYSPSLWKRIKTVFDWRKGMKDKEFLTWIHERLEFVHGEDRRVDYMRKLQSIIDNMDENICTPNISSWSLMCCKKVGEKNNA